ncbi:MULTISPECIES: hypothetical protein [unclassified Pseudonocardia]|uniref:hypothetical protein n=1 Tax=unclassified Pseudonocardia TaxID=2619320 RepID=UPI0001FFE037|nr:hypothetical protein [Pseudonocardia sp. Ae707_Ps1]OLM17927.1 hypothetical protein Ae707Ps1_2186c [Pseudonocardia sp. Ae707_Ps1]
MSISDRVDILLDVADTIHVIEQPATTDLKQWEDWTVARRIREHAANLLESR